MFWLPREGPGKQDRHRLFADSDHFPPPEAVPLCTAPAGPTSPAAAGHTYAWTVSVKAGSPVPVEFPLDLADARRAMCRRAVDRCPDGGHRWRIGVLCPTTGHHVIFGLR